MPITIPDDVRFADERRTAATRNADIGSLAMVLDDDVMYGHSNGVVDTKASYLEALSSGRLRYRTLDTTIDRVVEFDTTVVLHGSMTATIEAEGRTLQIEAVYLSVWRRAVDGCTMVAFQSARPPA
jgi:ketosteroid isomerase-like protein